MVRQLAQRITEWLDQVPVADSFERRQARSLQIFSLIVAIYLLVTEVARALGHGGPIPPENLVLIVLTTTAFLMVRRGAVRASAGAFLLGVLAVAGYDLFTGGLHANQFNVRSYALPLTAAGLLLGRGAMWSTFGFYAIAIAIAGARDGLQLGGLGPQAAPVPPLGSAGHMIALLCILAVVVDRFGLTLRGALDAAVSRQREAERATVELTTVNQALGIEMERRTQAEAQLVEAQKMEAVGQLAGGIAHDFNNALTAVITFTEFASQALPADHQAAKDLRQAIAAAQHAGRLTQDLLTFARRRVVDPRVVYVEDCVESLVPMLRGLLGERAVVTVAVPESPWPVRIDPGQLEQVFINLAVNARDAMPGGGQFAIETRQLRITPAGDASGLEPGDWVVIRVQDSGAGMSADTLRRAFEPFFTTKPVGHGTGLGLAICYGIVTQAGGQIRVGSAPGAGATVEIFLPRATQPAERVRVEVGAQSPAPGGAETILVVEDEPQVRLAAVRTLRALGYTVLEATTGLEGIAIAREHGGPLPLVITDVVMPHVGGGALAEWLRTNRPDTSVLFMSGYSGDVVDREVMVRHGAALLTKPFTPDTLSRMVRELLDGLEPAAAGNLRG